MQAKHIRGGLHLFSSSSAYPHLVPDQLDPVGDIAFGAGSPGIVCMAKSFDDHCCLILARPLANVYAAWRTLLIAVMSRATAP